MPDYGIILVGLCGTTLTHSDEGLPALLCMLCSPGCLHGAVMLRVASAAALFPFYKVLLAWCGVLTPTALQLTYVQPSRPQPRTWARQAETSTMATASLMPWQHTTTSLPIPAHPLHHHHRQWWSTAAGRGPGKTAVWSVEVAPSRQSSQWLSGQGMAVQAVRLTPAQHRADLAMCSAVRWQ